MNIVIYHEIGCLYLENGQTHNSVHSLLTYPTVGRPRSFINYGDPIENVTRGKCYLTWKAPNYGFPPGSPFFCRIAII